MQSFGDFTLIDALVKEFWRSLRSATHIFQPNYEKDPNYIRKSTEEHLLHFSNQIVIVEEIKMAHVKDGYIPRKLNQWLNKATDLKSQVIDALKKQQNRNNNDDPSLQYNELKHMCDEILDKMKDFPIEDVNEKPIDFIAPLHETEDIPSDDGVRGQDVDKDVASCDKQGKRSSITIRSLSGIVSFIESYGKPTLKSTNYTGETSKEDWISPNISLVQGEERGETSSLSPSQDSIRRESKLGMMVHMLLTGKMSKYVDLRVEILSTSSSQEMIYLNKDFGLHLEMDKYSFSAIDLEEDTSGEKAALLPEDLIVNRSGSTVEMPTDDEWNQAGVVNLIEKNVRLLSGRPDSPNLVILFLQRNSRLTDIPSSFFDQMPALCFLDLSDTRIKALPASLFELTNLQVLLLRSCVCLDRLPPEIKNLRNLKILDLLETDLSDLPKELGELTQLRYLQLSFYQHGSQSTAAIIFELQTLQGLSIVVDPNDEHWANIVGDIIKQVGELKMLSYLQFYFPSVEALGYFSEVSLSWKEQRLRSFKFLVGENVKRIISRVPDEVESKYEQYDRCLRFVNGNEVPEVMRTMLEPVTAFYLDHHLEIQSLTEFDVSNFKQLKFCVLRECPNIQIMVKGEERMERDFPNLEYLGLYYLWKLEKIWEDPIPPGSYEALKYLKVSTCGKLEHMASADVVQSLYNLETLIIEDCESLKTIVEENEMIKYDGPFLLPRLKELVLRHLPQLVALGRGFFPTQETLTSVHFCPKFILTARSSTSRIEWKKFLGLSYMTAANY